MKRIVTVVVACTLIAGACGGGDDASDSSADDTVEATVDDTVETTDDTGEATSSDDTGEAATADDTGTSDAPVDTADDDTSDDSSSVDEPSDDDSGVTIRSLDDIPQVCRDEMAKFLRAIEPIVSTIDWQSATMADFEQIALQFEAESEQFEAAIDAEGCEELDFVDESEGALLVEFARDEAPGAVGFLEFIEQLSTSAPTGDDTTTGDADLQTCQDAIDFLQGLMDDYESISSVPATELMKIPAIAAISADCTPEQMAFFDDPDLQLFMSE